MKRLDRLAEDTARLLARRSSRRSLLAGLGALLLGTAALPLLPVARGAEPQPAPGKKPDGQGGGQGGGKPAGAAPAAPPHGWDDPTSCNYWRHCGIDGYLCSCCGGTQTTCPPGTDLSAVTWIGTCHNPADGRDYVITYNDCCGKSTCGRCLCNRNERDTPLYQPGQSNDYNWCSGNSVANIPYHCTTVRIVGAAS
ncbi:MAG: methylamine dehydrogenase light chain [Steroidobacteraceae bacterium]